MSLIFTQRCQSSMTYHPDFAKSLQRLPEWTSTPIKRRAVVYGGDFENTAGDIWLLKYDHIEQLFKYRTSHLYDCTFTRQIVGIAVALLVVGLSCSAKQLASNFYGQASLLA